MNHHVAAVIPGIVLSVNAVLGQLEREPEETVVDPWVADRCCLLAERDAEVVAAALLHRFRADDGVPQDYALPALGCYGIPDTLPHIRELLTDAGFGGPTRTEVVLVAHCDQLIAHARDGVRPDANRTVEQRAGVGKGS